MYNCLHFFYFIYTYYYFRSMQSESGKKLNAAVAQTGKVVAETGKVVGLKIEFVKIIN